MKYPNVLYHYTSISTLAHILESKKIRFNRLDRVDDIEEGKAIDVNNISSFIYVSCWTNKKYESIPLWNMYTPNMKGVRIELPSFPFVFYRKDENNYQPCTRDELTDVDIVYPGDKVQFTKNAVNCSTYIIPAHNFLLPVDYVSKKQYYKNEYILDYEDSLDINNIKIGTTKINFWSFQKEWRYIVFFFPEVLFSAMETINRSEHIKKTCKAIEDTSNDISFFDMEIANKYLDKMIIMLGPKTDDSDIIIVESLIDKYNRKYNTNIKIEFSEHYGKIR